MSVAKKTKIYHYHDEWEHDYFFVMSNSKCFCLICSTSIAIPKKGNVQRHFQTMHETYDTEYPKNTEIRKAKIQALKKQTSMQQNMFVKVMKQPVTVSIASLRVCHLLAKKKKAFSDGNLIKECFLTAADTLFSDFKNKTEIIDSIKDLQLSRMTVTRRIEDLSADVTNQLQQDISKCVAFSLQFDESTDVTDTAHLMIFMRLVFEDCTTKEELLKMIPLHGRTRGQDMFEAFDNFVKETAFPVSKLVSITTDGAPSMAGRNNGFVALCRNNDKYPNFMAYHCIIHQQVLCSKRLNTHDVMEIAFKIVNSIRGSALQRRLFRLQSEDPKKELLLHTNVRWLSRSKFLMRFVDLLDEIKNFLAEKKESYPELTNKVWLINLCFLADFSAKLSELNLELQGKNRNLADMISSIRAFEQLSIILKTNLKDRQYRHFPKLKKFLEVNKDMNTYDPINFINEIESVEHEIETRFEDFKKIETIVCFFLNVFQKNFNIQDLSNQIALIFDTNEADIEMEIIKIQNDLYLQSQTNIWKYTKDKYPILTETALKMMSCFGSTYLAESAFSDMHLIKSEIRNSLSDIHLDQCLRLSLSSYNPDFEKIVNSNQCQRSH